MMKTWLMINGRGVAVDAPGMPERCNFRSFSDGEEPGLSGPPVYLSHRNGVPVKPPSFGKKNKSK